MAKRQHTARQATKKRSAATPRNRSAGIDAGKETTRLKRELAEALERQKATGEILAAISNSASEFQPILATIVRTASRLCDAEFSLIFKLKDGKYHLAATNNTAASFVKYAASHPIVPGRGSLVGRVALEQNTVHMPDCLADPEYVALEYQRVGKYRTNLGVPLHRGGVPIGVIVLMRAMVRPFTEKQIELVTTFANQAVIAIENARLFEELETRTQDLSESLQQQTATADVLKVISRSTFELQTVLETLVESAARLCDAELANIWRPKGDAYRQVASFGISGKDRVWRANKEYLDSIELRSGRGSIVGRALQERKVVQIEDVRLDAEFQLKELIVIGDYRTLLGVPLLREGVPVGVMVLVRCVVLPFTEKQIELLTTFADQAVIAIENVRLFDEVKARTEDLRQSLEYQTAISSVLGVISRSPSDIGPILDTIAETAQRLCQSERVFIMRLRDGKYHPAAARDVQPDRIKYLSENPVVPNRGSLVGRVALECRPVHILDASSDKEYTLSMTGDPGYRTMLGVPLLRDSVAIGVIVLTKGIVAPFSDRQIELVSTFADQALIAIENVRLFDELNARTNDLQESLQQQTATADVLKVISRSAFDLQTVFDTLVESATRLCEADHAWVFTRDGGCLHWTASLRARTRNPCSY